jgi:hypothetical protein
LVTSGTYCTGPSSAAYGTWWTYTSAAYSGSGTIQALYACMFDQNGVIFTSCGVGYNAVFVNACWSNNTGLPRDFPAVYQYDGGARHTIVGRTDDSPNHSQCRQAFET